jgi:hypothetical protein
MVFAVLPTLVIVPVAVGVPANPCSRTNPSPPIVTPALVSGVPS